jgi:putative ABC transport system permease protein
MHQARYHLSRSTASITPLFAGTALVGGLFTMAATTNASFLAGGEDLASLSVPQVLLIAGGPIALAAVGASVVVFMSNRTQGHEQALLRASGATDAAVLGSALLQAIIHVATALLLALVVLVATAVVTTTALARFTEAVPVIDFGVAGPVALAGLVLTVFATTLPVAARLREPVAARLAMA